MSKHISLGTQIKAALLWRYKLRPLDIGGDARLSKSGMVFDTESYEVEGVGHLCIMSMKAMAGLMKMETVILSSTERDVPLLNLDWVSAFGKETQIAELYDTQLLPYPQEKLGAFNAIKTRDADIKDYEPGGSHAYDAMKYPESYRKTGRGVSGRLSDAAKDYISIFEAQLYDAEACDREAKTAKIREFTDTLISDGGVAVNQMTKLFGRETAERVIRRHMYGVGE